MTTTRQLFLKPILKGRRFDDHSIPLDVLPEFAAYKSLLLNVAKHLYKQNHSDRQRLPKGFGDQLQLKISAVQQGSAVAVIEREFNTNEDFPEFEQARDAIDRAVLAATNGQPLDLPGNLIFLFENFGKSLLDDESMFLCKPGQNENQATRYSKEIRGKILSINRKPVHGAVIISGRISDVNLVLSRFEVLSEGTILVTGQFSPEFEEQVRNAHRNFETDDVLIVGTGLIAPDNNVTRIEKIQHFVRITADEKVISIPSLEKCLDDISQLRDGWFDDGEGKTIPAILIASVKQVLKSLFANHAVPFPYLYPTVDGHIRAEWSWGTWEISTDFVEPEAPLNLHATQVTGSQIREDKVADWMSAGSIEAIANFLSDLTSVKI